MPPDIAHLVSREQAIADPEGCAHILALHGCCVVEGVVSRERCSEAAVFVDNSLEAIERQIAEATGEADQEAAELLVLDNFGNVRCRDHRCDFKLPLAGEVREVLASFVDIVGGILDNHMSSDAMLTELSCLVSDPGAERQPLHPDTPISGNLCAPLLTAFVALQEVSLAMGPTIICPGTHTEPKHEALDLRPVERRASDECVEAFGGAPVLCKAGTVLLMDSRLLHCGGQNLAAHLGGCRRRLLYTTWQLPGNSPAGSTYSIRSELRHRRLRAADFAADGAFGAARPDLGGAGKALVSGGQWPTSSPASLSARECDLGCDGGSFQDSFEDG